VTRYFKSSYGFTLKNGSFLTKFSPLQNLKVATYKGFKILDRPKYPKTGYLIAVFLEIEALKKALSVRLKGIPKLLPFQTVLYNIKPYIFYIFLF